MCIVIKYDYREIGKENEKFEDVDVVLFVSELDIDKKSVYWIFVCYKMGYNYILWRLKYISLYCDWK